MDYEQFSKQTIQEQFGDYLKFYGDEVTRNLKTQALQELAKDIIGGVYVAGYKITEPRAFYKDADYDDPLDQYPTLSAKVYADLEATPERYLVYAGHTIKKLQRELEQQPTLWGYIKHKWRQLKAVGVKTDNW